MHRCAQQYIISRLEEESEKMWRDSGSVRERDGERTRQGALCTWIRVFPGVAVCCFGLWGWKPGVTPTAEVHSGHKSLYLVDAVEILPNIWACFSSCPLICRVHPPRQMSSAVAAGIFLKRCWCKCLQRHQLTLCFPSSTHTQVTAEMEQEAVRNRDRAAVSTGS